MADPSPAGAVDWSARHGGIDPAGVLLLTPWLRLVEALARPLRRVPPDAVSAARVAAAVAAGRVARAGRPGTAAALVVVSGVLDGVDGAVAAAAGRVSGHGRALDSSCDRVSELAHLAALRHVGVGTVPGAALLGLTAVLELTRRRAGGHVRLTAWERPSRVVLAVVGLTAAAAAPGARRTTGRATGVVGVGLAAAGVLGVSRPRAPSTAASPDGGCGGSPR
ncbi:hypothetical protein GCM10027047_10690 [Rhodococcus aerolatus]